MVFSIFSKAYFKSTTTTTTTTMPKRMTKKEKEERKEGIMMKAHLAKTKIWMKYHLLEREDFIKNLTDEDRVDKETFFKKLKNHTYYSFMVMSAESEEDVIFGSGDFYKSLDENKEWMWEEYGVKAEP